MASEITSQADCNINGDSWKTHHLSINTGIDNTSSASPTTNDLPSNYIREENLLYQEGVAYPSLSTVSSSSSSSSQQSLRKPNSRNDRLTTIARNAVLATKEQFWDSNESQIHVAQTAVDRWEELYVWVRNAFDASSVSIEKCYETSKVGVQGLDKGVLVPIRDYVLLPTFGVAEGLVGKTSSFLKSPEAKVFRKNTMERSTNLVKRLPFGLGDAVVLPAVQLGTDSLVKVWEIARYPVPSPNRVRETVDFVLNGSKHNLSVATREIVWYVKRADANIARTVRRTQWMVLGSGPYETLDSLGKQDVMDHLCERYLAIGTGAKHGYHSVGCTEEEDLQHHHDLKTSIMVAKYEFMANVWACNRSLYRDLVETGLLKARGGSLTEEDEWLSERPCYRSSDGGTNDLFLLRERKPEEDNDNLCHAFALWFRLPFENGQRPKKDVPWIPFDHMEGRLLEEKFRSVLRNDLANTVQDGLDRDTPERTAAPEAVVRLDEHEPHSNPIWEVPKYPTNSKWCNPDMENDLFLDQKRYAVRFVRSYQRFPTNNGPPRSHPLYENCGFDGTRGSEWKPERLLALPPPLVGLYRPTMWRTYGPDEIFRAVWFLDTPQHGPQPYGEDAQALLEDAYHFLKWIIRNGNRQRTSSSSPPATMDADDNGNKNKPDKDESILLTVQVSSPDNGEQQLVQFSSLTVATAIGRGLGGAISLFKRRVYRGAYNIPKPENLEDEPSRNATRVEKDSRNCAHDESSPKWTTTTEDALEKLRLTISPPRLNDEYEPEGGVDIDLDYKDCFDDVESDGDPAVDSRDQTDVSSSVETEVSTFEILPQLAYPIEESLEEFPSSSSLDNEISRVDHLVLVIHGIGEMIKAFDLFGLKKVPTIIDCCGYLRDNHTEISVARLAQKQLPAVGRVEYLPIEWHEAFSIKSTRRQSPVTPNAHNHHRRVGMKDISLRTIPNLRSFANDTLMDILYFMSPVHHDVIVDIVTYELNFVVNRYRMLTGFEGEISIIGHSLGSIIAWDILDHQIPSNDVKANPYVGTTTTESIEDESTRKGDGDRYLYPALNFQTDSLFLMGSPIPVFLMMRNEENPLDERFVLNGCSKVFNIFHPYDPVSYRIEPLIHPSNAEIDPFIMTHWNGGFRFQYQTKRLWKKLVDHTLRAEEKVIHRIESSIEALGLVDNSTLASNEVMNENASDDSHCSFTLRHGCLNGGRRIDYMLQEKEIDRANEYVAALAAHSCYWLEKDLSLFIANEICRGKDEIGSSVS